jgi:hypothetical protein
MSPGDEKQDTDDVGSVERYSTIQSGEGRERRHKLRSITYVLEEVLSGRSSDGMQ